MHWLRRKLKKYFIPHEENNHKPHLLRWQTVAFVLVIALGVESILLYGSSSLAPNSQLFGIIVANTLIDETNQNRMTNGDVALRVSPLLEAAAQEKADDMVANNYFAHTSPSGITPWYWFEQVGYSFTYAGENLAVNFSDSQDVTTAWMNSPEHRANILDANFTQIGMATATGTYEGHPAVYVVELFGAPAPAVPPAEPIAFINSASAAGAPSTPVVPSTTTKPKSNSSKTVVKLSSPGVVASSNPTFVAIQGVETSSVIAAAQGTSETASNTATATAAGSVGVGSVAPEVNPVQSAAANPRSVADDIYFAIIILFAFALCVNLFIKVRIQHPQVIFAGMLVILVAGLLIVLNQHALTGAVIL
jgi:hypothetical protein